MKRFTCEDVDDQGYPMPGTGCGDIPYIVFDGYNFGERLLEDVMFKAAIDSTGALQVSSVDEWETDPYLCRLNKDQILREAMDHITSTDVATCPKCGNDVDAQPKE